MTESFWLPIVLASPLALYVFLCYLNRIEDSEDFPL